jgi:hypothetical protein
MQNRITRLFAGLTVFALAVTSCSGDDSEQVVAGAEPDGTVESLCDAYRDAAPALFVLAFAVLGDDPDPDAGVSVSGDGPGVTDDVYVLVSPALTEGFVEESGAAREFASA